METAKHYSGVAMQVLREGYTHRCWRMGLKGMVQKTAAWLSYKQYLIGCKGVGEAGQSGVAIPFPKCFPIISSCSKGINESHCRSAVFRPFFKNQYFPFTVVASLKMDNTYFMRTTSEV